VIKDLQALPGIGPVRARALVKAGVQTRKDLVKEAVFSGLPNATKIALNFKFSPMYKWDARVAASSYRAALPPEYELEPAGEIRRGQDSSLLTPFLIFHPDAPIPLPPLNLHGLRPKSKRRAQKTENPADDLFATALRRLRKNRHLKDTIKQSDTHWEGVAISPVERVAPRYWHVLIKFYNPASYPATMIHHTGDDKFLAHLDVCARKKGMYLDEWGLWATSSTTSTNLNATGVGNSKEAMLEMVPVKTEEELMSTLGLEAYVSPEKRNFGNILMKRGKK